MLKHELGEGLWELQHLDTAPEWANGPVGPVGPFLRDDVIPQEIDPRAGQACWALHHFRSGPGERRGGCFTGAPFKGTKKLVSDVP